MGQFFNGINAQLIEFDGGVAANSPHIGKIWNLPNSIGDVGVVPFGLPRLFFLGGVIQGQFGQQGILSDANRRDNAGCFKNFVLNQFGNLGIGTK